MNRKEFIEMLEKTLKHKSETIREIVSDFNEHFNEATKNGKSESEICEVLGDPIEIANHFNEEIEDEEKNLKDNKEKIFVNIRSGNIILDSYDGDKFDVKVLNKIGIVFDEQIRIYEDNGGLYIKEEKAKDLVEQIFSAFKHRTIRISVPKGFKGSIYIKVISGNIKIKNEITPNDIECKVISGNIKILDINSKKGFDLYSKSGNIFLSNCIGDAIIEGYSGNISVKSHKESVTANNISGNIDVETNIISREALIRTKSGNLNLILDELLAELRLSCVSGNINFKINKVLGNIIGETKSGNITGRIKEENNAFFMVESSGSRNEFKNTIPKQIDIPIVKLCSKSGNVKIKK